MCTYNYGVGFYKRVKKAFYFSLVVSTVFFIIMTAVYFGTSENVLDLFTSDDAVNEIGTLISMYLNTYYWMDYYMWHVSSEFREG